MRIRCTISVYQIYDLIRIKRNGERVHKRHASYIGNILETLKETPPPVYDGNCTSASRVNTLLTVRAVLHQHRNRVTTLTQDAGSKLIGRASHIDAAHFEQLVTDL